MATFRQLYTYTVKLGAHRLGTFTSKPAAVREQARHPGSTLDAKKGKVQVIIRQKGYKPLTESLDNMTKAKTWARVQEAEMSKGTYAGADKCRLTISQLMALYEARFTVAKQSARQESDALKHVHRLLGERLVPVTGMRPGELSTADIRWYVKTRRDEGVVSDTIRKELNPVSNCLNVAGDAFGQEHGVPHLVNVVQKAKAILKLERELEPGVQRERRIWQDEIDTILGPGLRSFYSPRAFRFAYNTGMRRSEICQALLFETWFRVVDVDGRELHKTRAYLKALDYVDRHGADTLRVIPAPNPRVKYVNRAERTLYLPAECTKTDEERYVYLTDEALQVLDELPASADGRLFVVQPDQLTNWVDRRTTAKGIEDLRWHDARHEALSRMAEMGMNVVRMASYSGHRDLRMLQRYLHPSQLLVKRDPVTGVVVDAGDAARTG